MQSRPLLASRQLARPLRIELIGPQRIALLLERGALLIDLAADGPRRERLAHEGAVALGFLPGNLQRRSAEAAAGAGPDRKAGGAARQNAELRAVAAKHFDAADPAVGVGIELYGDLAAGGAALGHLDQTGGAANAQRRGRRIDLHIAGMGDLGGDEGRGAAHDVEYGGIVGAALLIDEFVHREARVRLQRECRLVVEGDAERAVDIGLQHVVLVDRIA